MNSNTPEKTEIQEKLSATDTPTETGTSVQSNESATLPHQETTAAADSTLCNSEKLADKENVSDDGTAETRSEENVTVDAVADAEKGSNETEPLRETAEDTAAREPKAADENEKLTEETPSDTSDNQSETPDATPENLEEKKLPLHKHSASELKDRLRLLAKKRSVRIVAALVLFFLVSLLTFRWYLFERPVPFKVEATDISVMVSDGDSARRVMDKLSENGLDVNPSTMRLAARFADIDLRRIHAGLYKFEAGLSPVEILEKMSEGALADQHLRIPDGAPIWEVMKLIRSHQGIKQTTADKSEIEIARLLGLDSPSLEGWIAPDTYHFAGGTSDLTILRVAVKQQQNRLQKAWENRTENAEAKTLYEALILASIIEKETGHSADRALISSVFNNRLRIKMPLQTDPTVIYGIGEKFDGNLRRRDLNTATPYNTYKIQGLPPTPIATPSPASLEAAMHPADTKFLYFVSRGDGTSQFSTNLKDHNRAVRKYILKRH